MREVADSLNLPFTQKVLGSAAKGRLDAVNGRWDR
jgi:hypothetical protein